MLDRAEPGQVILSVNLSDGVDAVVLRTTDELVAYRDRRASTVAEQIAAGRDDLSYQTYLTWRGFLQREPPRRPDPERPAAPPSLRTEPWKYGFVGSKCTSCGTRHLPPARVCVRCGAVDQMEPERLADVPATIATYTIDRLAFSLSPPVVVGVIDFDGGGRFQCELTDVDPATVKIGDRVEMTLPSAVHRRWGAQLLLEGKAHPLKATRQEASDMASHGIRDKVAIVGMGCTPFGEHWDKSADDLLVDAATEAFTSAGIKQADVDAYWLGTMGSGISRPHAEPPAEDRLQAGHPAREHVRHRQRGVPQRVPTPSPRARIDVAMAIGVEKLKDSGFSGLAGSAPPNDGTLPTMTAPASFSLLAPAYAKKYGVDEAEMKDVLTRIAWKNHKNGALNPRAQFRKEVAKDDHLQLAARRRPARHLRLLGRERRLGRRDRSCGPRTRTSTATTRST